MTLKEIAEKAGVSTATVSYVLNGTAKVSDETRQKVERIIKETGYQSNILARSLRKNKTSLVGVVVEDVTVWHTAFIIDGINELAERKGYQTILGNLRLRSKIESQFEHISQYQGDIDREVALLLGMQVDGIIYVGMHDRTIKDVLHDIPKPVVYCYCYTSNEGSSVTYSNEKAAYQLTKIFLKKGHREFAVIKGNEKSEATANRMHGIKRALKEYGIDLKNENVVVGNWQYKETRKVIKPVLQQEHIPTAFIAMNDEMAVAVRDEAKDMGLVVPDDISISGFDNSDIVHYGVPKITTVDRPLQQMGYRSMELLIDKIEKGEEGEVNIILPCKIIEGTSIREI
ncbi:LacI family DNA-binding transcriptional regulator [Bariatricus sp. HCP28S3_E4]|uniref:LacI family DNA-binding transcriptional regulator n=1 Tax=Lachnospiraceae TaxID=186803 RepID=UPI002A817614|nr:LacI family DNA-binding transcriptional regulator [Anaerobutyricum hallii]MDY4578978.1 LacI family DNA-binding transcriptional regulator [Anaerobutyricum hallii]